MTKHTSEHVDRDVDHDVDNDVDNRRDTSDSSSSSSNNNNNEEPSFRYFPLLPPELRAQVWRAAAVPAPGINFFNVHAFPGDHPGANRSSSPPWIYLDARRLAIGDSDEQAARYDPSAWQARLAVRQACREARGVCARAVVPEGRRASVVLTRPRRGLYIRAGDEQLRWLTPMAEEDGDGDDNEDNDDSGSKSSTAAAAAKIIPIRHEPKVTRTIRDVMHVDDILCLSFENCSFNMPYEENIYEPRAPSPSSPDPHPRPNPEYYESGWAFDPQLTPLPSGVPRSRYCINLARVNDCFKTPVMAEIIRDALADVEDVVDEDGDEDEDAGAGGDGDEPASDSSTGSSPMPPHPSPSSPPRSSAAADRRARRPCEFLIMADSRVVDLGASHPHPRSLSELPGGPVAALSGVYRDRFDDAYVPLPFSRGDDGVILGARGAVPFRLVKVAPERTDMRVRYLRSAQLRSAKRPAAAG